MKKKHQHIVPKSYQKAWCDSSVTSKETPYIWLISKDGQTKKRRAPQKAFVSTDPYTIRLPDGERELVIEDTLMKIEGRFVQLLEHKIKKQYALDSQDKAILCAFAAAMTCRVNPQARNFEGTIQQIHEMVLGIEEQHSLEPRASQETAAILENLRPRFVAMSLPIIAPVYFDMPMALFVAPATDQFITSDNPTVWYNPEAYRFPPFYRSPGLAQRDIEVTLPLSPQHALFFSHNKRIQGYVPVPAKNVQDVNRRTRFHSDEWFVPWQGEIRDYWFEQGALPEDRWENTPEAMRETEEGLRLRELQRKHEEPQGSTGSL